MEQLELEIGDIVIPDHRRMIERYYNLLINNNFPENEAIALIKDIWEISLAENYSPIEDYVPEVNENFEWEFVN